MGLSVPNRTPTVKELNSIRPFCIKRIFSFLFDLSVLLMNEKSFLDAYTYWNL